jgi:DNA-binding SARP family transcriptional activator/predicted ATPase
MLKLSFLGAFSANLGETTLQGFESAKVRALLAYLMLESEKPHSRDHLTGLLWGEGNDIKSAKNMRQALSNLRKTIQDVDPEQPFLLIESDTIRVNKNNPQIWLDTHVFETLISTCEKHPHRRIETCATCANRLIQATQLYRGELLDGFTLKDSQDFQDWLVIRREYFRQKMLWALEHLTIYYQQRREYQEAISYARRLLSMDDWREEAHVLLIRLLSNASQRSAALKQYQQCRRIMLEEFGVEPQPETIQLYQQILNRQHPSLEVVPPNNLPSFGTTFVGRRKEILHIVEFLQTRHRRLVTVSGPGGVGKTRLALQVGQEQLYAFQNGVYWIPLDNIEDANALPGSIANAIGIELPAKGDIDAHVLNFLRHRDILLILDNYESLLPETDFISKLLSQAPGLSILVTSRESLHLQSEWMFELTGLPLQVEEADKLPAALLLLEQRAERVEPQFHISIRENYQDALRLCEVLEGLPLGIELAGSMLRKYTCAEIAEQISQDIGALTSTFRDIPSRHRSLWVVFDYSWNLLSLEEQQAFASLGVFHSRFTTAAAFEICAVTPVLLDELCRKSLVRQVGKDLYSLHPLLQQYARKKQAIIEISEENLSGKFKSYYGERCEQWERDMKSDRVQQALNEFSLEWVNLTAAWHMALTVLDFKTLNIFLSPFFWFFEIKGKIYEGEALFHAALATLPAQKEAEILSESFYYRLLVYYGWLSFRRGQTDRAADSLGRAVDQGLGLLNIEEQIFASNHLGSVFYETGQKTTAHELHEKAMRLCENNQSPWNEALTCNHYGSMLSMDGSLEQAMQILQRGARIAEANQFTWITSSILSNLAVLAYFQQEYQSAINLFLQSNEKSTQYGDLHRSPSVNHNNLAECYIMLGQLDKASKHLDAALHHFNECGNIVFLPYVYNTLAVIYLQSNKFTEARRALYDGIHSAVENQMQAVLNNLLIDFAKYFLMTDMRQEAAKIIHYVSHSSHTIKEGHDKASQLIEEFGEGLRNEISLLGDHTFTQQEILSVLN